MNPRKALLSDADIVYDFSSLEEHWKKLRSLGLLHFLLGSAGLALQYFSEAFSKEPSGLLLLAAGLLQGSAAVFYCRGWKAFWTQLGTGLLYMLATVVFLKEFQHGRTFQPLILGGFWLCQACSGLFPPCTRRVVRPGDVVCSTEQSRSSSVS